MKKLLLMVCFLAVLLFSCPDNGNTPGTRKFWAQDISKAPGSPSRYYQLTAELLAENRYCKVWAEKTAGISEGTAQKVADAYSDIYIKMINAFGLNFRIDNSGKIYNTIELADYIGDGDGKFCILLLDIKDGYQRGINDSYVAGYFYSGDLFDIPYSNMCDMMYIDTYPGEPGEAESNSTLAHELQHLMNVVTSLAIRNDGTYAYAMDTWIDEGLSSAAEWVYSGRHSDDRLKWYNRNGDGGTIKSFIDKGNNFFVWNNRTNENQYAVLDDYATVYLFFQWLRLQSNNGTGIYRDIISYQTDKSDYNVLPVTEAAEKRIDTRYKNWESLLGDWLAANYINSTSGLYGYKNDPDLKSIKGHFFPSTNINDTTVSLYPGEGVYSKINAAYVTANPNKPADTQTIKYSILTSTPGNTMAEGTLLTYNANSINKNDPPQEEGTVTGVTANVNIAASVNGRAVASRIAGPFRIGAGDVRHRGAASLSPAGVYRLPDGFTISE